MTSWKKMVAYILMLLCVLIVCAGCKKDEEVPDEQPEESVSDEENPIVIYPEIEPPSDKTIRLRTDLTEEYRDITLRQGDKVDIPNRTGYTFTGYQDDKDGNGVTYIDENGEYILEYTGTELLVLWPIYEADEYMITICEDNQPIKEFSRLICKYDENVCDDLPWGKVINKKRKTNDEETCVIVGFENGDCKLDYSQKDKKIILEKMGDYADHEEKTLFLNVVTTDLTDLWQCLNTRQITNAGFLKQELGSQKKTYDCFAITKEIDLDLLRQLGYKNMELKLTISKGAGDGTMRVVIASDAAEKDKNLNDKKSEIVLVDTGKFKENEFEKTYSIPLNQVTGEFYIYYNSENLLKETWDCAGISIELSFVK